MVLTVKCVWPSSGSTDPTRRKTVQHEVLLTEPRRARPRLARLARLAPTPPAPDCCKTCAARYSTHPANCGHHRPQRPPPRQTPSRPPRSELASRRPPVSVRDRTAYARLRRLTLHRDAGRPPIPALSGPLNTICDVSTLKGVRVRRCRRHKPLRRSRRERGGTPQGLSRRCRARQRRVGRGRRPCRTSGAASSGPRRFLPTLRR